jgi:hypothetical protein|eukprot:4038763-Prymnesium_polylepis.2
MVPNWGTSSRCIAIDSASTTAGAAVRTYTCAAGDGNHYWTYGSTHMGMQLVNTKVNRCLRTEDTTSTGTWVNSYVCTISSATTHRQSWTLVPVAP